MNVPAADEISRTALLNIHDKRYATAEHAFAAHHGTGLVIVAGLDTGTTRAGQAALCTAIATGVRAFGTVVVLAHGDTTLLGGPYRGATVAAMVAAEGGLLVDDLKGLPRPWPAIVLGPPPSQARAALGGVRVTLDVSWKGWTACVRPARPLAQPQTSDGNVLAAIAAAAVGVHEAFAVVRDLPGSDGGYRMFELNLWRPGNDLDDGPPFAHAPAAWWLVGLGHLGQANAWVLSWLDYANPDKIPIVLQDTDKAVLANHSTGMLTPRDTKRVRKTRLIAAVLDNVGFDTQLIERYLDENSRTSAGDYHVALLGLDKYAPRRLISAVGWPLLIDSGLGRGPGDFNAITLHRFPASRTSDQIPAWIQPPPHSPSARTSTPALQDLRRRDKCGGVEIAGTAVGAAFVGVTAACLGVAEAIRAGVDGHGHEVLALHMQSTNVASAPAVTTSDIVTSDLRLQDG